MRFLQSQLNSVERQIRNIGRWFEQGEYEYTKSGNYENMDIKNIKKRVLTTKLGEVVGREMKGKRL